LRSPFNKVEFPGEALYFWHAAVDYRPTLLLFSNEPLLLPVPENLRVDAGSLLLTANRTLLATKTNPLQAAPLLLPAMTIDAALRSGWFSEFIWVVPVTDTLPPLNGEVLRRQLLGSGYLDATDKIEVVADGTGVLKGTLRGTAFRAVTLAQLSPVKQAVVHIDQDWFLQSIRNEIATPLFALLEATADSIHKQAPQRLVTTFCYGNLDGRISLDVRFAGEMLGYFLESSSRIGQELPPNWRRMKDILYLQNFFKKEMVAEIARQMGAADAKSAWVQFVLYRSAAEMKEPQRALRHLDAAVMFDSGYAVEYLNLVWKAYEARDLNGAMRMLERAEAVFPENPEIKHQIALLAHELGEDDRAKQIARELLALPWSELYHPGKKAELQNLSEYLNSRQGKRILGQSVD